MKTIPNSRVLTTLVNHKITFFIFWMFISLAGGAKESKSTTVISLKNDRFLSIKACSDNIFRIRISTKSDFPESLMERYGIVKTDWGIVNVSVKPGKGVQIIQTSGYKFKIDTKAGDFSVLDSTGNLLIERIAFSDSGSPLSSELARSLNSYFGKAKSTGGIIGDSNSSGDQSKTGDDGNHDKNSLLEISLKQDERFYGGGSTSRKNIQHRGSALRMWATYQKTEIPMPFLMSSAGWGIFNNTTSLNYFDVGRFQNDKLLVSNTGGDIDFYLMFGNSMVDVLNEYTTITGKPYLLPQWAYGLAFGGNTQEDQIGLMNDAVRFRDEKIPCDIFWIEPQWMAKNYDFSTSKNWNLAKFPAEPFWEVDKYPKYENRTLFVSKLHNLGFKLALWLCIDHDLSIAEEDLLSLKSGKPQFLLNGLIRSFFEGMLLNRYQIWLRKIKEL